MRRQMQLRPSQGGKMRGPVGEAQEMPMQDLMCACGYYVCAKTGECAPVGAEAAEPEPVLRYADGQEVRVGDVFTSERGGEWVALGVGPGRLAWECLVDRRGHSAAELKVSGNTDDAAGLHLIRRANTAQPQEDGGR